MVEELWSHALMFLDLYRTGGSSCHIGQLYQFADQTGILETHKQCLAQPFQDDEVNMKMMYYELIRLMLSHERSECKDMELYDSTKSVGRIEGYQELTNKMQRGLNQRFIKDIEHIKRKLNGENLSISGDENINQKIGLLENKCEALAEDTKKLRESCSSLETTNNVLGKEIEQLKETILDFEKQKGEQRFKYYQTKETDSLNTGHSPPSKIETQNEAVAKLDDKMQKVINQANTLLINDATHLDRISNLESKSSEFERKMFNMESADLYLQESHRMLTERTCIVEKYSKYVEEKVNFVTNLKQEEISSSLYSYPNLNNYQEELEKRIQTLEQSMLVVKDILKIKEQLEQSSAFYNIENINTELITEITRKEKISKIKTQETNKNFMKMDPNENKIPNYNELADNYKNVLEKVDKIETAIGQQSRSISEYFKLFSEEYMKMLTTKVDGGKETEICKESFSEVKSEKLETLEIHSKEFFKNNGARDVIIINEEIKEINRQLHLNHENKNESSNRLANLENDLLTIFRKNENQSNIFEFLEIVVGLNKSLNQMTDDFISSQSELHWLRDGQKEIIKTVQEQKQILSCHNGFEKVFRKIEPEDIKEIFDYEIISQKTQDMEDIINKMKTKIDGLEDIKINTTSIKEAKEEDFKVNADGSIEELRNSGLSSPKRQGSNRWLANWFARQHGAICC